MTSLRTIAPSKTLASQNEGFGRGSPSAKGIGIS